MCVCVSEIERTLTKTKEEQKLAKTVWPTEKAKKNEEKKEGRKLRHNRKLRSKTKKQETTNEAKLKSSVDENIHLPPSPPPTLDHLSTILSTENSRRDKNLSVCVCVCYAHLHKRIHTGLETPPSTLAVISDSIRHKKLVEGSKTAKEKETNQKTF